MTSRNSDFTVWGRDSSDMVGDHRSSVRVGDVLDDSQVCQVVKNWLGETANWQLVDAEMRPAGEGMAGFFGDHFRLTLKVSSDGRLVTIPLFVKCLPLYNAPKAEFIDKHHFFRKEMTIFKLIEEMETEGPNPFVAKALLYNASTLVMRDLVQEGYCTVPNQLDELDLPHVLVTLASIARFHAAIANHETRRGLALNRPYSIMEEHGRIIVENSYKDTPWIHAGAKLAANVVQELSDKYRDTIPDLEGKLLKQFLAACGDMVESKDSLNVVLHKDLWVNNVMFKYDNGVPTNSILLDFQCVRYGPPAFDVMFFLHTTTSRRFRALNEAAAVEHYFKVFSDSLDEHTKLRMKSLGYDYEDFLRWIDFSRRFGVLAATMQYPYVLMDGETARATFDDPATFEEYTNVDRSAPVLAHARRVAPYGRRLLDAVEEFVERYIQIQP